MQTKPTWPPPAEPHQLMLPLPEPPRLRLRPPTCGDPCHRCGHPHETRRAVVACFQAHAQRDSV